MEEKKTHPEMMKNVVFNKCRIKSGWKEKFIEKKKYFHSFIWHSRATPRFIQCSGSTLLSRRMAMT